MYDLLMIYVFKSQGSSVCLFALVDFGNYNLTFFCLSDFHQFQEFLEKKLLWNLKKYIVKINKNGLQYIF